ncbi:HD domain-containing protein [Candidatus Kaiserbacteria bacterium]|nr:HD domain-containing protein [Candidatus Kaiserbacteria bacterium]MCB9811478.1 HD domain-containing protein [Candidatus Nomurabacteria bacterium]
MLVKSDIPKEVLAVASILEQAGFEAYLVGGCVRDLLLGRTPKDWDITTDARPEEIEGLFPETYCNNDYGTVGVVNEDVTDATLKVVEVTPYRTESGYSDARRPDAVEFGVSLEEDLKRRDFTINAIAFRPKSEQMVDLFDGVSDLKKKRLKTVGNPDERFGEDALRMMRAIRLATELNFAIEGETLDSIVRNGNILSRISAERIRDEFLRIIDSDQPMQGVALLERLNIIDFVLPEIREAIGCEQGGIHAYDVYEHLLRTLQAAADKGFSTELRLAALLHDIGKPATRRTGGKNKHYTFFGHEVVGARMTEKIMKRLKMPKDMARNIVNLVRWHMFFADPDEITLSAVRRTIVRIGEEHIEDLLNLRVCDRIGTGRPKEQPFRFRKYKAMVDQALRDPVSVKMLQTDGGRIMEQTGEKPGKKLGYILHALLEEVLENPEKNTEEYLDARVLELLKLPENELISLAEAGKERQKAEEMAEIKAIERSHKVG